MSEQQTQTTKRIWNIWPDYGVAAREANDLRSHGWRVRVFPRTVRAAGLSHVVHVVVVTNWKQTVSP